MRRVDRYCELALADAAVRIAPEALTERERVLIAHTVDLMDAIATNVHQANTELTAALARCRADCPGDDPPEMAVVA